MNFVVLLMNNLMEVINKKFSMWNNILLISSLLFVNIDCLVNMCFDKTLFRVFHTNISIIRITELT